MLARVRLMPFRDRYPKELSGGQQQRVALARALIITPKVLLLDEPFSSLDAKLRKQLRDEFLEIHRNFNITSVFVTHDLEEAFALSDKVAVMNAGVIEQFGAPRRSTAARARASSPTSSVTRTFSKERSSARDADAATMTAAGLTMRVPPADIGPAMASIPVHRLQVARIPVAATNAFPATVDHVSYLGPFIQITVRVGDIVLESHQPSSRETESLRAGDAVHVGWESCRSRAHPGARS